MTSQDEYWNIISNTDCKCNIFFPMKDSDKPPIIVIKITDNRISRPGIENGK